MDETEFWQLVDTTRETAEGDPEEQADLLVERLVQLDPDSVLDFSRHFESRYNRAYRWDLWGAAWVLLDGASDDAFDFFRCWLIGQGREVFEGAMHDPDTLAELLDDFDEEIDGDGEELGYAADEAYEQLTGAVAPHSASRPPPPSPREPRSSSRTSPSSRDAIPNCGSVSGRTDGPAGPGCQGVPVRLRGTAGRRVRSAGMYACGPSARAVWCCGAALAWSSADAVTAAGPRTTVATAHTTAHGPRAAVVRPVDGSTARMSCPPPVRPACAPLPVRLILMIPASGQRVRRRAAPYVDGRAPGSGDSVSRRGCSCD